ncbi:hypothetical protein ACHQM5_030189 [Ranunculus cassubicifolius]
MEQDGGNPPSGVRQLNLKKSFKLAIRAMLTACSKQDVMNAFPTLDKSKQEALYQLFVKIVMSSHKIIQEDFESICVETNAGEILDTVEQLVEERSLDVLYGDTSLVDARRVVVKSKKDEIEYLKNQLKKVRKEKNDVKEKMELVNKERVECMEIGEDVERLRCWNSSYLELMKESS